MRAIVLAVLFTMILASAGICEIRYIIPMTSMSANFDAKAKTLTLNLTHGVTNIRANFRYVINVYYNDQSMHRRIITRKGNITAITLSFPIDVEKIMAEDKIMVTVTSNQGDNLSQEITITAEQEVQARGGG